MLPALFSSVQDTTPQCGVDIAGQIDKPPAKNNRSQPVPVHGKVTPKIVMNELGIEFVFGHDLKNGLALSLLVKSVVWDIAYTRYSV